MMIYPPYLKLGNTIGIVCPSGYMPIQRVQKAIEIIKQWGFEVKLGKTVGHQYHYFSGTDAERLQDVQSMLDDPSIDAILCGRGGYGLSKIIDAIDFSEFRTKRVALFINNSVPDMHYYGALSSLFFQQFLNDLLIRIPSKNENNIFFLLDEASSMYLPGLSTTISNIRKYNSGILLIYQE